MQLYHTLKSKILVLLILLFSAFLIPDLLFAQEADTTRQELEIDSSSQNLDMQQEFDRSMSGGMMSGIGTYETPTEGQYYKRPFKGQYYLDKAVEAYREQLREGIGNNWYSQFLKAVSPFVSLHFGAFQEFDLRYVERDNPLFQSYTNDSKKQ